MHPQLRRYAFLATMFARLTTAACFLFLAHAFAVLVWHAGQPVAVLQHDLVADAAMQPLAASLGGLQADPGSAPLWTLLVAGLSWLVRDPETALRAQVLLAGGCWLAAGWLLFALLRPLHVLAGALALLVWLQAGLEQLLVLRGLETGLVGLLLVLSLGSGQRLAQTLANAPAWHRRAATMGLWVGLLCLAHPPAALLAALWLLWVLMKQRQGRGFGRTILATLSFLLPLLLTASGLLAASVLWFGDWSAARSCLLPFRPPVSAAPEAWLQALDALARHCGAAVLPGAVQLWQDYLLPWLRRPPTGEECAYLLAPLALPLLPLLPALFRKGRWPASALLVLLLALFVALHLVGLALLLRPEVSPPASQFAPQILCSALLLGCVAGCLRRWWQVLLALPLLALLLASTALRVPTWWRAPDVGGAHGEAALGHQLAAWLPAGTTVGAFASGQLAFAAPGLRVVDLDGAPFAGDWQVANTPAALRNLACFADTAPAKAWRLRLAENPDWATTLPAILLCWPAPDSRVTACLANGGNASGLVGHPLATALFSALVQTPDRLLPHSKLAELPADQTILASFWEPDTGSLSHLLVPNEALAGAVDRRGLDRLAPVRLDYGSQVSVLAWERVMAPGLPRHQLCLRVYLQPGTGYDPAAALELGLRLGPATAEGQPLELVEPLAHGSKPGAAWTAGTLLSHTFLLSLPAEAQAHSAGVPLALGPLALGPLALGPLALGVRTAGGDWLPYTPGEGPAAAARSHAPLGVLQRLR